LVLSFLLSHPFLLSSVLGGVCRECSVPLFNQLPCDIRAATGAAVSFPAPSIAASCSPSTCCAASGCASGAACAASASVLLRGCRGRRRSERRIFFTSSSVVCLCLLHQPRSCCRVLLDLLDARILTRAALANDILFCTLLFGFFTIFLICFFMYEYYTGYDISTTLARTLLKYGNFID